MEWQDSDTHFIQFRNSIYEWKNHTWYSSLQTLVWPRNLLRLADLKNDSWLADKDFVDKLQVATVSIEFNETKELDIPLYRKEKKGASNYEIRILFQCNLGTPSENYEMVAEIFRTPWQTCNLSVKSWQINLHFNCWFTCILWSLNSSIYNNWELLARKWNITRIEELNILYWSQ